MDNTLLLAIIPTAHHKRRHLLEPTQVVQQEPSISLNERYQIQLLVNDIRR